MKRSPLVLSLVATACFLASAPAHAAVCGSLQVDDDAQEVIIGEFGPVRSILGLPPTILPSSNLGVCWRDEGGAWNLEQFTHCDTSASSDDTFVIYTEGGDDYVATLLGPRQVYLRSLGARRNGRVGRDVSRLLLR